MPKDYFDYNVEEEVEIIPESEKEAKVVEFVYQVCRKTCTPGEYISWLQDGRIIEEVIFKSCPTPLGKKQRSCPEDQMKPRERVEKIINDLFEFGVPVELLFDVDDLLKSNNIPKVTACLLEVKMMVYTGQGRSKLKSVQDVVKAPFRCSVCKEKFSRSDQLRHHLCENHPDKIGFNLRALLQKMTT
ncbi:uncharacterized protein LOC111696015 isoform X1 [Eurytemora carolleeae]|uniref:uncharacterized protein LOC111696015 isoform X1 n=1 Tax=Eurytemora carolleeae TaxID=1294199 RepID=UPI000C77FC46|nr:uncharacterized protein LOC111696015 isoform X1 [Eurytemora carolleeae]|eukprot:XP_023321302.1 uncharacterized protein LOC111696015 isoform X1 [Eurytemora affinis]